MCHIPNINSVARGIKKLLKKNGLLIFEDPYLGDIVKKTSYDQIQLISYESGILKVPHLFSHQWKTSYDVYKYGRRIQGRIFIQSD